jgi:hypothetical protein
MKRKPETAHKPVYLCVGFERSAEVFARENGIPWDQIKVCSRPEHIFGHTLGPYKRIAILRGSDDHTLRAAMAAVARDGDQWLNTRIST